MECFWTYLDIFCHSEKKVFLRQVFKVSSNVFYSPVFLDLESWHIVKILVSCLRMRIDKDRFLLFTNVLLINISFIQITLQSWQIKVIFWPCFDETDLQRRSHIYIFGFSNLTPIHYSWNLKSYFTALTINIENMKTYLIIRNFRCICLWQFNNLLKI